MIGHVKNMLIQFSVEMANIKRVNYYQESDLRDFYKTPEGMMKVVKKLDGVGPVDNRPSTD